MIVSSDQPGDLIRTSSVLGMLDRDKPKVLRLWHAQLDLGLPTIDYVEGELNLPETNFGTLLDPPPIGVAQPIILDIHNDALIVISSEEIVNRVDSIMQAWTVKRLKEIPRDAAGGRL